MINRIDLRVNGVTKTEISQLNSLVNDLPADGYQNDLVNTQKGDRDFILTLQPVSLPDLKNILHNILRVVNSERIAIET
ncbi:hypothetical protein MJD09_14905 [bacterium]|nr:hypothetical protein [bacterium]